MKHTTLASLVSLGAGFALLLAFPVHAQIKLVIDGNGEGSENSAQIIVSQTTTVKQSNTADVTNDANASADTGGNSGGNVTTGDASSNVTLNNTFNSNKAYVDPCCATPTPTPDPGGNGSVPTPTPTIPGGNGGNGGNDGNGGNGGSSSNGDGSSSSSSNGAGGGIGGAAVLGLAATSSAPNLTRVLLQTAGLLLISAGVTTGYKRR